MNKLLPFLVASLFFLSLIPIGSGTVTIYVGDYFYVGNETYGVTQTMIFSYTQVEPSWIKFNTTDFNVTSANNIYMNLSFLHEDISMATNGTKVLDFVVNVTIGTVTFSIGGFSPLVQYSVNRNSTEIATPTADANGYISFSNSIWSHKHFEINVSSGYYNALEIIIGDDADFNAAHYVFSGTGTAGDPYIIENLKIKYLNISGYFNGSSTITKHFKIYNCDVWAAWIWGHPTFMDENLTHIDHCYGNNTNRPGYAIWKILQATGALVTNCTYENNTGNRGAFEFSGCDNSTVRNSTFKSTSNVGIRVSSSYDVVVENCDFTDGYVDIYAFNDYRTIIRNCTFNTTGDEFVVMKKTYDMTIDNCSMYDRALIGHCVEYQYGMNLTFTNNVVDTTNRGIEWSPSTLYSPTKITGDLIANNEFKNNDQSFEGAIGGRGFQNCTIRNNTFTDCKVAIRFSNTDAIFPAAYNLFYNNTFLRCKHAVRIYTTASGWVFDNYFYNNSFTDYNVTDSTSYDKLENNTWYTAKTLGTNIIGGPYIGGNYWDDYTGSDTDSDGLGDTDLPFPKAGMDIYPLADVYPKEDVMAPPINGTTEDPYVELYGYCSLGLDSTNFSSDINVDIYAPILWTVEYVNVSFITNNSIVDQTIPATDYIQYNNTYRRYSCEYNPSNTLSGLDMGWFDVNVSAVSYNATHQSTNYTIFDNVFQVYRLSPPVNISSTYTSVSNTFNFTWDVSSENYSIFRPNAIGGLSEMSPFGATNNWQCVDDTTPDNLTTNVYEDSASWKEDLYGLQNHTTESDNITRVSVYVVLGNSTGASADFGIKTGGTVFNNGIFNFEGQDWCTYSESWVVNPKTSVAWSWNDIDNLQAYVSLYAYNGHNASCTQTYIVVDYEQEEVIADSATDSIIVVRNNNTYPICPTDGYEVQNSTAGYYNTSVAFNEAYFSLFAYNDTTHSYSEHIEMEWGVLGLNCYNESNPSQAIGFDIEITNSDATETYTASDLTNTQYIDINDIPYGDDTIFVVSNSSYRQRIYYKDLELNHFYNYSFYLPPIHVPVDPGSGDDGGNTTTTKLYLLTVVGPQNEYTSPPVEGAKITIKTYNNATDTYTTITSVLTDANGEADVYLIPFTLYKVTITKDGYDTETSDYTPSNSLFTKTFRITPTITTPPDYDIFWDDITFTGAMYVNGTIKVTYSDSNSSTVNTQIYLYDVFNSTYTLNDTHTDTGDSSFVYWVSSINTSRDHELWLYFNNTANYAGVTSPVVITVFAVNKSWGDDITKIDLEQRFESNFGPLVLGYVNVIAIIIPIILLCIFGMYNVGLGILTAGVSLGFMEVFLFVWTTNAFNPLLALMCPVAIAIGFLYVMTVKGEEHV
jgi:copper-binding protein NosD